jgi:hypothetical protein
LPGERTKWLFRSRKGGCKGPAPSPGTQVERAKSREGIEVKGFRQGKHDGVEDELRRYRPEPRAAFLTTLLGDLHEQTRRPRVVRRAALVTVLSVAMLAVFATFGGIGYASSAATSAFQVSKLGQLVGISHTSHAAKTRHSPLKTSKVVAATNPIFGDEYRPGKGCGDKNHIHTRSNECKK